MGQYFIGVDQGTSGTTVLLLDESWRVAGRGFSKHRQIYPKPGWAEHDPEEIFACVCAAMEQAVAEAGCRWEEVASIGLDNQGETCLVWEKATGRPLYNAIVWQDRRTAAFCDEIGTAHGGYIRATTGLLPDAYFSATKYRWILDNIPHARSRAEKGELLAGTLDTWLIWKLTGGAAFVTDASTASCTMLMNMQNAKWDKKMLEICGVPENILPPIMDCSAVYGRTAPELFGGAGIPIAASLADAHAALFAQNCRRPGDIKATYGTGCFINMVAGERFIVAEQGLTSSLPMQLKGKRTYALGGSVYVAGAALGWLRDGLQILDDPSASGAMAMAVPDTNGVVFVPAFTGLAAPWWDQYARGMIIGLTGGVTRAHVVRAALESIAFQVNDNLEAMQKEAGGALSVMKADGQPVDNPFLMQFQADILGIPIEVPAEKETSALGAAFLAALAVGHFASPDDVAGCLTLRQRYEPRMAAPERDSRVGEWRRAVERCRGWAQG